MMADFAHWTPVAFSGEKGVAWADLRDQRFDRPFFSQTVDAWTDRGGQLEWTSPKALAAFDALPSREPDLIIAHASRCGSTLLARMMSTAPGTVLISEPTLLTDIMTHGLVQPDAPIATMLGQAVRALGRSRFGDETRYILKLSSGATRFLPVLRRVLPETPTVWLQRRPEEIFMSELRHPSHWVGGRNGAEPLAVRAFRKIALGFLAAKAHVTGDMLVLDYLDLPDAAWKEVCHLLDVRPDQAEIAAMRDIARYHAKSGQRWAPREDPALDPTLAALVEREILPLYLDLDRSRSGSTVRPEA